MTYMTEMTYIVSSGALNSTPTSRHRRAVDYAVSFQACCYMCVRRWDLLQCCISGHLAPVSAVFHNTRRRVIVLYAWVKSDRMEAAQWHFCRLP